MQDQIDARAILAFIGFFFALIAFFYKNHETNQLRILKNISDNIKSINEICISVFAKNELEEDVLPKIFMYLDLLELNLKLFPACKFYTLKFHAKTNQDFIMIMLQDYKDLIFTDTPIENRSINIKTYKDANKKLDLIIQKSIDILRHLESYLP